MKSMLKLATAAALACAAGTAIAEDPIGVVRRAAGSVQIQRADAVVPTTKGTQLRKGDRIVTGKDGYIDITMRGRALSVGPYTDVPLDRFAPDDMLAVPAARPAVLQGLASLLGMNRHR